MQIWFKHRILCSNWGIFVLIWKQIYFSLFVDCFCRLFYSEDLYLLAGFSVCVKKKKKVFFFIVCVIKKKKKVFFFFFNFKKLKPSREEMFIILLVFFEIKKENRIFFFNISHLTAFDFVFQQ